MNWKRWVFVVLVFVGAALVARGSLKSAEAYKAGDQFTVTNWIRSSECAATTGKVLILCIGNKIFPIAEQNPGDDPGHALLLGSYAAFTGKAVTPREIAALNWLINISGITLLAGLLFWLDLPIVSAALLVLGSYTSMRHQWVGPHAAQFGATCMAMIPAIVVATASKRPHQVSWFIVATISLALASMFRQSSGMMGLVAVAVALAYKLLTIPRTPRAFLYGCSALCIALIAYKAPSLVLAVRDFAYQLEPSTKMETHGIWHNLYIGLGAVPNPFGIEWLDDNAFAHAKSVDPNVILLSKNYYEVLRQSYFDIVAQHPIDVLLVYVKKLEVTLLSDRLWFAILFSVVPVILIRTRTIHKPTPTIDAVAGVSFLFACFFLAQATLFHWMVVYMFPIQVAFIILIGCSGQMILPWLADLLVNKREPPNLKSRV